MNLTRNETAQIPQVILRTKYYLHDVCTRKADISLGPSKERKTFILKKKKNNGSWKRCLRAGFPEPVEGRRDRCAGWPPDWGQWADGPGPLRGHTSRLLSFWGGCWNEPVAVPAQWQEGSRYAFLMTSTLGHLLVFGWESFTWVRCTGFADGGLPMGSIPGAAHW